MVSSNLWFYVGWGVSGVALLLLAGWVGKASPQGEILGILIDTRGRYSLTHLQIVLWTIVILSSFLGVLVAHGWDAASISFPPELLGLMGISAGSAVCATGVKGAKDASGSAKIARQGAKFPEPDGTTRIISKSLAQIWLEEEGSEADKVVSITKFQNFIFTLVILVVYISIASKSGGLPQLPDNVVWLIGISHAGYVGGKIPNK